MADDASYSATSSISIVYINWPVPPPNFKSQLQAQAKQDISNHSSKSDSFAQQCPRSSILSPTSYVTPPSRAEVGHSHRLSPVSLTREQVMNVAIDPSENGSFGSVPMALKKAYAAGDYHTIRDYATKSANDINPIYENMRQNAEKAFFKLHNDSDNRDYYLSISGPRSKPTGYYWAYCPDVTNGQTRATEPAGQIGVYSTNSQTLGISNKIWGSKWANIGVGALTSVLVGLAARYAYNRIAGMVIEAAADAAAVATGEALVAAGVISSAAWAGIAGLAAGFIVGAVIGAAAFFLFNFLADFIVRDYWVAVNIYNWDLKNTYKVTQYHEDNSEWAGGGSFKVINLEVGGSKSCFCTLFL